MIRRMIAVGTLAASLSMMSLSGQSVCSSQQQEEALDTASKQQDNKEKDRQEWKEKYEASMKKWNALSDKEKDEVYKIVEERQSIDAKMLDKLASLGIMDSNDVVKMKAEMEQRRKEMKDSGKFPLRGPRKGPKKTKEPFCKEKNS